MSHRSFSTAKTVTKWLRLKYYAWNIRTSTVHCWNFSLLSFWVVGIYIRKSSTNKLLNYYSIFATNNSPGQWSTMSRSLLVATFLFSAVFCGFLLMKQMQAEPRNKCIHRCSLHKSHQPMRKREITNSNTAPLRVTELGTTIFFLTRRDNSGLPWTSPTCVIFCIT